MVLHDCVSSVHEVVAHEVYKVERLPDRWASGGGVGNQVSCKTWNSGCEEIAGSDGFSDLAEQKWVGGDLICLVGIWVGLVVGAVSGWVFPINVCILLEFRGFSVVLQRDN